MSPNRQRKGILRREILKAAGIAAAAGLLGSPTAAPGSRLHIDARRIKDLFVRHPNVRLCLSGHLHLVDRVEYLGVTYLCNGAVSGAWWKGNHQECEPGYALIDLHNDGSFEHRYVTYGWKAETA